MSDLIDYGPCHACGGNERVRDLVNLTKKAPVPGTGWGCCVCDLKADGAVCVVCDECIERFGPRLFHNLRFAFRGYPVQRRLAPIETLTGEHRHDVLKHLDLTARLRAEGRNN